MREIWKPIKGYEGEYSVSNLGRVRSEDRTIYQYSALCGHEVTRRIKGKIKQPTDNGNGYKIVDIGRRKGGSNRYVHRLVAEAFIGDIPEGMVINHKDFDRSNNRLDNLEIITQEENIHYSRERMKHPRRSNDPNRYIRARHYKTTTTYEVTVGKRYVGTFRNIEEARNARDEYIKQINYY